MSHEETKPLVQGDSISAPRASSTSVSSEATIKFETSDRYSGNYTNKKSSGLHNIDINFTHVRPISASRKTEFFS